ncbi:MAG: hypothetical protein AM324_005845 [Candidatus Thorarchaeota archaeon SMTZ1-83]|jgi:hypothetical protein|nr:MAG: hypothetical protein AM324_06990 [Candidatus Thorarchaeota archaeon SMTZ1-83]
MIPEILVAAFLALGLLYVVIRILAYFPKRGEYPEIKPTSAGKLYHSKVNDAAFFDGASEDYAEAMNRTKQLGGA